MPRSAATKPSDSAAAHLAAIVESSNDAIISLAPDGIILSWNPAAQRLYGYSAGEIIGQPISILIPPGRAVEPPTIMDAIKGGKRIEHYETVRRRKDGRLVNVSLSISPVRDSFGIIIGAAAIARDITERKQYEAFSQLLSTPVLPIREGLLILPLIGTVDDTRSKQVREQLLSAIHALRARAVVVDVTGVPGMDAAVASRLAETVEACRLLGARVILTGVSAAIAKALVEAQVDIRGLTTYADLQRGIEEAERLLADS